MILVYLPSAFGLILVLDTGRKVTQWIANRYISSYHIHKSTLQSTGFPFILYEWINKDLKEFAQIKYK